MFGFHPCPAVRSCPVEPAGGVEDEEVAAAAAAAAASEVLPM